MKPKNFLQLLFIVGLVLLMLIVTRYAIVKAEATAAPDILNLRAAMGTVFTYQGRLTDGDQPANGAYDFRFTLHDAAVGGSQIGSTVTIPNVTVTDGFFTVSLDFGAEAFTGEARYLEIAVKSSESSSFTTLAPRQVVSPAPYALHAQIDFAGSGTANTAARSDHNHDGIYALLDHTHPVAEVPIGTVIDWWRPDASWPVPEGFKICDGSVVDDADSPLDGETLPNLNDRFIRGVTNPSNIGTSGGIETHSHTVDLPWHNHSIAHDHANASTTYRSGECRYSKSLFGECLTEGHSHNVDIPAYSGVSSTYDYPPVSVTTSSHLPPYVGLLKIMRIK